MYARIENNLIVEYPLFEGDIRARSQETLIPAVFEAPPGFVAVTPVPRPPATLSETFTEGPPALVGGAWTQVWVSSPATADEAIARKAAIQRDIVAAVQERLDAFARTRGYDGILSACTYASSNFTQFAAEGQYCVSARDNTWAGLYGLMAIVQAGNWPTAGAGQIPTRYADIEASLPTLTWP